MEKKKHEINRVGDYGCTTVGNAGNGTDQVALHAVIRYFQLKRNDHSDLNLLLLDQKHPDHVALHVLLEKCV